jgi:hypothetical protein
MLLMGAEINKEIEFVVAEQCEVRTIVSEDPNFLPTDQH